MAIREVFESTAERTSGVNICGLNHESVVDGEGVRAVVFFSGCPHNCKGCHNPASHDADAGIPFDDEIQNSIIDEVLFRQYVAGVTLSGGEPMHSAKRIVPFVKKLRAKSERTTIWIYSGYTFEEIVRDEDMAELLSYCDVLVDGRYIEELRDPLLQYRGSSNQRILDVRKSLEAGIVVLWQPQ